MLTVGVELTVFGEQSSREIQPDELGESSISSLSGGVQQPTISDCAQSPRDLPPGSIGSLPYLFFVN